MSKSPISQFANAGQKPVVYSEMQSQVDEEHRQAEEAMIRQ